MKLDRVVAVMVDDVEVIVAGLAAALAHLGEWSGEYPGSASGAPPSSSRSAVSVDDDSDVAVLTRLELLAESGDPAMRTQLALLGRLRLASTTARNMFAALDGAELPVIPMSDAEDLAVLRWALRRLSVEADRVGAGPVGRLARQVEVVRRQVDELQPPSAKAPSGCRLHRAAGDHVELARDFVAVGLCRRCGEFRRLHRFDPSPAILRAWSKGQKPTAGQVAEAIAAGKKKRRKRRRDR